MVLAQVEQQVAGRPEGRRCRCGQGAGRGDVAHDDEPWHRRSAPGNGPRRARDVLAALRRRLGRSRAANAGWTPADGTGAGGGGVRLTDMSTAAPGPGPTRRTGRRTSSSPTAAPPTCGRSRPQDAAALQAFHLRQSPESTYLRFFAPMPRLSDADLARFTTVDHVDRVALVATVGDDIVAVGRYDRIDAATRPRWPSTSPTPTRAAALGSVLLEHLAAAAREHGIHRFVAEVLPQNRRMLGVFRDAGYEVRHDFEDGVVSLSFDIDPTERSLAVMERREHRAEFRSVAALLAPRSVVLVGASRRPGTVGHRLLRDLLAARLRRSAARGASRGGRRARGPRPSVPIADLPRRPRLPARPRGHRRPGRRRPRRGAPVRAGRGPRARRRQRRLRGDRRRGARAAAGARPRRARQRHARGRPDLVGRGQHRPGGPAERGAAPGAARRRTGRPLLPVGRDVGVGARDRGAPRRRLSTFVSAGNRADVSGNDCMQYWEEDERTSVVGLYLESMGNPRKFSRIARRLAASKPVVVVRPGTSAFGVPGGGAVGRSELPADAFDAMLSQSGCIRVGTVHELLDVAELLATQPLPGGSRVGVVANSEALAALVADAAVGSGLTVPRDPVQRADHRGAGRVRPRARGRGRGRGRRRRRRRLRHPGGHPRGGRRRALADGRPGAEPAGPCSRACSAWRPRARTASRPTPPPRRRSGRSPRSTWSAGWRGREASTARGSTRPGATRRAARGLVEGLARRAPADQVDGVEHQDRLLGGGVGRDAVLARGRHAEQACEHGAAGPQGGVRDGPGDILRAGAHRRDEGGDDGVDALVGHRVLDRADELVLPRRDRDAGGSAGNGETAPDGGVRDECTQCLAVRDDADPGPTGRLGWVASSAATSRSSCTVPTRMHPLWRSIASNTSAGARLRPTAPPPGTPNADVPGRTTTTGLLAASRRAIRENLRGLPMLSR